MSQPRDGQPALQTETFFSPAVGFAIFQITSTVSRLGIPDALGDATRTPAELAAAVGVDTDALTRLLRAATAVGVVTGTPADGFALTELGAMFRSDAAARAADSVALNAALPVWRAWGGLEEAVRTGKPAFDCAHGEGLFDYLAHDPELAAVFHGAMASGTASQIPLLVPNYDLYDARHVIDIGGGNGTHLAAVLRANEHLRGTVVDTESGLRDAPAVLAAAGVADRCDATVADFFVSVPAGGDVYLVKNVLTDWDDEACVRILRSCREAMAPDGRILVIASVLPEDAGDADPVELLAASVYDISLMVLTTGRERTLTQYGQLFARAGLRLGRARRVPPDPDHPIMILYHTIEALPA